MPVPSSRQTPIDVNADASGALRLLLRAMRASVACPAIAAGGLEAPADPPLVLFLAASHGVMGAMVDALLQDPTLTAAGERSGITSEDLKARRLAITGRNLAVISNARRALALLDGRGIPAVVSPSPGAALMSAGLIRYELGQASVMVLPKDLLAAREVLAAHGYREEGASPSAVQVVAEGLPGARLMLETTIARAPVGEMFDLDLAFDRAVDVAVMDGRMRMLAAEDRLLAVCARGAAAGWPRLEHVAAVAALARGPLDWSAVIERAQRSELEAAVFTAALVVQHLLAIDIPIADCARRHASAVRESRAVCERFFTNAGQRAKDDQLRRPRASSSPNASREVWIAGFPSPYGGADTELDHLIDLLRDQNVAVHLVPMFGADGGTVQSVVDRGCQIHDYRDDVFRDQVVVSFCNGEFLGHLASIVNAGPPRHVIWFNCMTWLFDGEKAAHERGWIDVFGFQSQYQRNMLIPLLEQIGPVRSFRYRPYFNPRRIAWRYREWNGSYRIGRISRDDAGKFASDTWSMYERVAVPAHLKKATFVLGYGPNAAGKIGPPPDALECRVWAPGEVSTTEFFRSIDTMIHRTGGSRENSPRVLFEAYAHGVVPIVERAFAFPELVVHGETGFMAGSAEEMSEYASRLARDPREHRRMAENGRRHLEDTLGDAEACWQPWLDILESL